MAGHAYRYEEDDDRKLDQDASVAGSSADAAGQADGQAGSQSLAEISLLYGGPGGGVAADAGAGPDLDQLSLHGTAPEPSHVDPGAAAVAQAEIETSTNAAPAHKEDNAADDDAGGPDVGTVREAAPSGARAEAVHEDVPSPGATLAGAAHGMSAIAEAPTAASAAKPAAGPAHPLSQAEMHELLDDPAPAHKGPAHPLTQAEMHEMLDDPAPAAAAKGPAHPFTQAELHELLDDPAPAAAKGPAHPFTQAELHELLDDPAPAAAKGPAHPFTQAELHELLDDPAPAAAKGPAHPLSQAEMHEMLDDPAPAAAKGPAHPLSQAEMHEMLDDPAPAATTAAAPAAATTAAAPGGDHAKAGSSWQDAARAYNQRHGLVAQFNAATNDACGSGSEADPNAVAAWQKAHGIAADGRIGRVTLAAAAKPAAAKPAAAKPAAAELAVAKPAAAKPAVTKPAAAKVEAHIESAKAKPIAPTPVATPTPVAAPAPKPAPAPVAAPAVATGTADSFVGTDNLKGPGKDRWTSYGKGDKKTYGWDLGGTHGVKHSGGDVSAAISAVSNVEGRYDSVQTYDAGILSFGIMQWTLHAGSLQKFLGFLKDKSGPEGRAAFQDDFAAKGIDVKPAGGQYQLWYNGKEYALGADGEGKAAIDKLVREDKETARRWSEIFAAAGADSRVQKAQFERAKEMYHEAEGIKFSGKIVDQSLKACKNTFHAKYRELYGKAETWMSASPKAATLFFSMRVNNPKYANAAFLKAIDAFYDSHGTDRVKWPASWGDDFGNLVEAKCKETLSNWHSEGGDEGRVEKTLRFWNKVHGQPGAAGSTSTPASTPAARPAVTPAVATKPEAAKEVKVDAGRQSKLRAQYAAIMQQFIRQQIDQAEAVKRLVAYDEKLNGGSPSLEGLMLLPLLLADLLRVTVARATSSRPAATPAKGAAPTPTPAVVNRPTVAPAPLAPAGAGPAFDKVYKLSRLPSVHAYAPPGGVKGAVDVFLFLHGMYAHHGGDPHPEQSMHLAKAMAQTGRNLVALAPSAEMAGEWPLWKKLDSEQGYVSVIKESLKHLSEDLGANPALTVGSVSLAGHSAGGSALGEAAKQLGDDVHDITMQDGGYGGKNFNPSHGKLVDWLVSGNSDKILRVIVRGNIETRGEGAVLKTHVNPDAIKRAAAAANHPEVSVSTSGGNHDPRSVQDMYLHHTLHVNGLKGTRTVLVYNMPQSTHWDVRNNTTDHLITEGKDTEFAGAGAVGATPSPAAIKNEPAKAPPPKADAPHPQVEAAKKLADPSHTPTPTDGKAFHDGGKDKELGAGDEAIEVVSGKDHIAPVFPATPEGMVMAAMYELHRGDKRSMAEIMADHTAAHWQQGKDVAVEQTTKGDWKKGAGLNDDGDATKHGQVVGHVHTHKKEKGQLVNVESPIGPIQAYKTAAGMGTFSQGKDPMWCGAFVTYCLARCGIDVGTLKYVPSIAGKIAAANGTLFSFETTMTDDGGGDRHKAKYTYGGSYSEGKAGDTEKKLQKKTIDSAESIDIRPGDIFYSAKHTGIIAGVNKTPNQIVIRTIEGNSGDAVVSNVRTIEVKNGKVTSAPFAGWGRPSQFGDVAAPQNDSWIEAGKGKKHHDEGKTT